MATQGQKVAVAASVVLVAGSLLQLLTVVGGVVAARQIGLWSYVAFPALDVLLAAKLMVIVVPLLPNRLSMLLERFRLVSWLRQKLRDSQRMFAEPSWQRWRRYGDVPFLFAATLALGPIASVAVVRMLGYREAVAWHACIAVNVAANAVRITVYLWFGDFLLRTFS